MCTTVHLYTCTCICLTHTVIHVCNIHSIKRAINKPTGHVYTCLSDTVFSVLPGVYTLSMKVTDMNAALLDTDVKYTTCMLNISIIGCIRTMFHDLSSTLVGLPKPLYSAS